MSRTFKDRRETREYRVPEDLWDVAQALADDAGSPCVVTVDGEQEGIALTFGRVYRRGER